MQSRSRRKAREVALRTLYEIDLGHAKPDEALEGAFEEVDLVEEMRELASTIVRGVRENREAIDDRLGPMLRDYELSRTAAVDRNLLRLGAFEILFLSEMPPAVTINEVIEISKKYSTAESGKFLNGVLGRLLRESDKANWIAPAVEDSYVEEVEEEPVEELTVEEGTPEADTARKFGVWKLRSGDVVVPPVTQP